MSDTDAPTVPEEQVAPPRPPKRRKRLLLYAIVLVCGFVCGFAAGLLWVRSELLQMAGHPERMPDRMARMLDRRLDLTDEQEKKVRAILMERHKAVMEVRREAYPRIVREFELTREKVLEVLTPDQREKWKAMTDRIERKWLAPFGRGMRGHRRRGFGRGYPPFVHTPEAEPDAPSNSEHP